MAWVIWIVDVVGSDVIAVKLAGQLNRKKNLAVREGLWKTLQRRAYLVSKVEECSAVPASKGEISSSGWVNGGERRGGLYRGRPAEPFSR